MRAAIYPRFASQGQNPLSCADQETVCRDWCAANGNCGDPDDRCAETDPSTTMEGLYVKVEQDGQVVDRMKFVRQTFTQPASVSGTPWHSRPIVQNLLRYPSEGIYEPVLPKEAME